MKLRDDLLLQLQALAAKRGKTIDECHTEAVENYLRAARITDRVLGTLSELAGKPITVDRILADLEAKGDS